MGKVNPTTIQTKIRVMRSQIKQPINKDQVDSDSALRLMQADLQRKDKEHFMAHARSIVRSRKRFAGFQRIMEALTAISDNSIDITSRAAKEKSIPAEFAEDITIVSNVGPILRIQSFNSFRSDIIQSLYPKAALQGIAGSDKLPAVIQDAFLHDGVTEQELMSIYEEFASINPDFPKRINEVFGIAVGMGGAPQMPQQIPGAPVQGYPQMPQQVPGAPVQGYPQMQGYPQGSSAPPQQYQAIDTLFVPVGIPEFTRDRWGPLSQAIAEATG